MRIAFIGTRGIPAKYGGAETFVTEVSQKLVQQGFEVYVTCNSHRFAKDEYKGIIRIHSPAIEGKTFTVPAVNEFVATIHLLLRCPKINLIYYSLNYGALAAIFPRLLGKKVIVNADGIEWKRPLIRKKYLASGLKTVAILLSGYMKLMEWLTIKFSHVVIADSRAIKTYLEERYGAKNVVYISYGARELLDSDISPNEEHEVLQGFSLTAGEYYLDVGRIVAENNMHLDIEGFKRSKSDKKLVIIGNFNEKDRYTKYLLNLSNNNHKIVLLNPIYERKVLGILRKDCYAYIDSREVCGTGPSLLEQMLFGRPIMAYDVVYHREVLEDAGIYFRDEDSLASAIGMLESGKADLKGIAESQARRIKEEYNWDYVAKEYCSLFTNLTESKG